MKRARLALLLLAFGVAAAAPADDGLGRPDSCRSGGLQLQVLGSGGPDLLDGRAGSGFLVWIDGKARILIDAGSGTARRFRESGANAADLDVILFTHLHADHTVDLPALVELAIREQRPGALPIYGPIGNRRNPSTVTFVRSLFDSTRGVYRYLGDVLSPLTKTGFKLEAQDVRVRPARMGARRENPEILDVYQNQRVALTATYVIHGDIPALAWLVRVGRHSIAFTGDTNGAGASLERLVQGADLLVASHALTEDGKGAARQRHMPPSVIGRIAAGTKRLVLAHHTGATLRHRAAALAAIRTRYAGPVVFAEDLDCFVVR